MRIRLCTLLACAAAVCAGCGDDDEPRATSETRAPQTATESAPEPTATTKAPPRADRRKPTVDRRKAAVQVAISELVEAFELSDEARICELLGQSGADAEGCAARVGVDLMLLPSSEELSFDRTRVEGARARVVLASGTAVSLQRSGGRWVVSGLRAP